MKYICLAIYVAVMLSGCASGPAYKKEALSNPNNSAIYIYRESKFMGAGAKPSIFIDGDYYGVLNSGGYLRVEVEPGEHDIEIGRKINPVLSGWKSTPLFLKVNISPSEEKYYKFVIALTFEKGSAIQTGAVAKSRISDIGIVYMKEMENEIAVNEIKITKKIAKELGVNYF